MSDSSAPRRSQFSLRTLLVVMAVVAAMLALFYGRSATRDLPAGRYQVVLDKEGNPMMFDTATGQGWVRYSGGGWAVLPVPKGVPADASAGGAGR